MERKQSILKRAFAFLLAFAMCVSGISITPKGRISAEAAEKISISSAEELAKIGIDPAYPMNGDYVLTGDIDLEGRTWIPIGGSGGNEYGLVSGERVFNGTFDGAGHVIYNLTIDFDGSSTQNTRNQSGLFAMIGSDDASDYAKISNLNFSEVSIRHNLGMGDSIGTLAGDVNGYVYLDNIAVLSGEINVSRDYAGADLVGVGGIAGQVRNNANAVKMTNLYNAADLTANAPNPQVRCGGILGRIHQSGAIGELSSCLNRGQVTYQGSKGYAILGYSSSAGESTSWENIRNCYFLTGSGLTGAAQELTAEQMGSEEIKNALGEEYWMVSGGQILPIISTGKVTMPIPSPEFAEGDKASAVTKNFTLPISYDTGNAMESITWTSSNPEVISIEGENATVHPVLADTQVTLTGESDSKRTKSVTVTVLSNLTLELDQEYAKPGTTVTAAVKNAPEGISFSYRWEINGRRVSDSASYTPVQSDLNQFITVTAMIADSGATVDTEQFYCSKLPVVYINTNDGYGITSKKDYKGASMRIQGNDKFNSMNSTLYDGDISIRGRGNSTWNLNFNKLPYKIKLDKKTNLLGMGESKHWALLANYMDESLLRNKLSYNLSGNMGMLYLPSAHVEVILNGTYAGNYQLVGNVRIEKNRVNIHNWEDCAEDAAKAIGKKEGITGDRRDQLEDQLNQNMQWITSDTVNFEGTTYKVSDYYELPKDQDGNVDLSGGFLFELDAYCDEVSTFLTNSGQPIMFKNPEYAATNSELFNSAKSFIQAVENSFTSQDFYEEYQGETRHYTDLVDMDSLVRYFTLNEFFWNTETMKKSTYMYKDLGGKLFIGPVWDMDWTSNSIVSSGQTGNPRVWMTTTAGEGAQSRQWYRSLIGDPYFVTKVYECYKENRQNFEDIVKNGGILDQDKEYLKESAQANYNYHYLNSMSPFETETERLRTFLNSRLDWLDQQFGTLDTLMNSLGKFKASSGISVSADTSQAGSTVYTAEVTGSSAAKVGFYVNGILAGTADVTNRKAVFTASDDLLEQEEGKLNVVQVRAMQANGSLISSGSVTNYAVFEKEIVRSALTGTVSIEGDAKTGAVLSAKVKDTNNTGVLSYQWMADGMPISGADSETLQLTEEQIGAAITVAVTSSIETGNIVSTSVGPVVKDEVKNDHIIINQVYGGGSNDGTPVSHSFIELYNPTDSDVDLSAYTLGYLSNGKTGTDGAEVKVSLTGTIPPYHSYLIRCEAQDTSAPELIKLSIEEFDQEWDQVIDNKRYQLVLYRQDKAEDAVSVNEGNVEGQALEDGTISKQKAIRRVGFADTNNNSADFTVVDYRTADSDNFPRSLKDGAWGKEDPGIRELEGSVAIRGNAIAGATLYADEAVTNNTGILTFQWMEDGADISQETGQFLILDESYVGKAISVRVESTVEKGSLFSEQTDKVLVAQAQREHLVINQVYGGGQTKKGGAPVSHSFIELYNPREESIALTGYSIRYLSGDTREVLELTGQVPPRSSYLIQCAQETNNEENLIWTLKNSDQSWDQVISNKNYSVVLLNGTVQIDAVAVNEEPVEGSALTNPVNDEIISKNKAIRRIGFIDTDQNADDFEVLNYSKITPAILDRIVPRCTSDGSWGLEEGDHPIVRHTVTFSVDGVLTKVKVEAGEAVKAIPDPVKEGYEFAGWYLENELYDFTAKVTQDITLVAKWTKSEPAEPEVYKVTFSVDGVLTEVKVTEGELVKASPDPVKEGYEFAGWYLENELYDFTAKVTQDIMLVAKWNKSEPVEPEVYTVTFSVDGVLTEVKVTEGEAVKAIPDPAKEGYDFSGWYFGNQRFDFSAKITQDLTLTAGWTKKDSGGQDQPVPPVALAAPSVSSVKSAVSKGKSRVSIRVNKVKGASSYQIYRKKGSKTTYVGKTSNGMFHDEKPVSGKVTYLAKATNGTTVSANGKGKSITLPKATARVSAKSLKGRKTIKVSWKRVKDATGYMVFRSTKSNGGYKRIAVIKKGKTITYTDQKVKKGKKYYYRVITVKKKLYGPAKTSKAVKVK